MSILDEIYRCRNIGVNIIGVQLFKNRAVTVKWMKKTFFLLFSTINLQWKSKQKNRFSLEYECRRQKKFDEFTLRFQPIITKEQDFTGYYNMRWRVVEKTI